MNDPLQYVEAQTTRIGQRVRFADKKAWWKVERKEKNWIVLTRGKSTKRVNLRYRLLQQLFDNIND